MTEATHHTTLDAVKKIIQILEEIDEDQRPIAMDMASQLMGIRGTASTRAGSGGNPELPEISPKEFLKQKAPVTDAQRVACLAYYLARYRDQPHFKTSDITKLNTEAAYPRFSNAATTVKNATNQNHFLTHAGKGSKQITAYGEDVVEALPDQNAVKSIIAQKPTTKKRKSKKKANK